ncbi:uncharacterized protein [Coffea arabica]|uniref:Uncharacterized protein n=1 Tax=Coffea arabica TaxID=13443 RepID=A0A6P6SVZ4_COFAR|nr:uncharacterized protein LOC113695321 [Coffea arabica]
MEGDKMTKTEWNGEIGSRAAQQSKEKLEDEYSAARNGSSFPFHSDGIGSRAVSASCLSNEMSFLISSAPCLAFSASDTNCWSFKHISSYSPWGSPARAASSCALYLSNSLCKVSTVNSASDALSFNSEWSLLTLSSSSLRKSTELLSVLAKA